MLCFWFRLAVIQGKESLSLDVNLDHLYVAPAPYSLCGSNKLDSVIDVLGKETGCCVTCSVLH